MRDTVKEYVDDYEFRGDEGDYPPTAEEKELIYDAIRGFLDEIPDYRKQGSELEVEKRCDCANGIRVISTVTPSTPDKTYGTTCMNCKGTGTITRPLTNEEAAKLLHEIVKSPTYQHHLQSMHSGGKVRVKK